MLAILLATTAAFAQDAPRPTLFSYEETVRCSGLAQAASELEGGESQDGQAMFDMALYWSLTATQAAAAAGKPAQAADADQTRARILAVQQLNAAQAPARAELARCRARTPDLG